MIVAIAILVITRIDFMNLNSFHILILFLMFLMLMLRWGNMRKEAVRKQAMERYRDQFETDIAMKAAETVENVTVDGEAVPVEETPAEEAITAEPVEETPAE